jgi:hypothetical protein
MLHIIPGKCEKALNWQKTFVREGENVILVTSNPLLYPWVFLYLCFKNKNIIFYVRYLNDFKSFTKSLISFLSFYMLYFCKLRGNEIHWIIHNIDTESTSNFPYFTIHKRKFLLSSAQKIFVTSPVLIDVAYKEIGRRPDGVMPLRNTWDNLDVKLSHQCNSKIKKFRERLEDESKKVMIGLCVTSVDHKCLHLKIFDQIFKKYSSKSLKIGIVFIGNFSASSEIGLVRDFYVKSSKFDVLVIDMEVKVDEKVLLPNIDFMYRSLSDYSTPLSVMICSRLRLPLVTHRYGATPLFIDKYKIGFVVDDFNELTDFWDFMSNWKNSLWSKFDFDHQLKRNLNINLKS